MSAAHEICKYFEHRLGRYGEFSLPVDEANVGDLNGIMESENGRRTLEVGEYLVHTPNSGLEVHSNGGFGYCNGGTDILGRIR